jgi:hypothetical protein
VYSDSNETGAPVNRMTKSVASDASDPRTSPRVLFLDFDGVLHSAQGVYLPEFSLVPLLEKSLESSDCAVVISSTWREHYPLQVLRERLGPALGTRVIGALGPDLRGPHVRYKKHLGVAR